jgi:hypothetical protein
MGVAESSVAVWKFAGVLSGLRSGLPNLSDTSRPVILVSLLNPKFAKMPAEQSRELRIRDTKAVPIRTESMVVMAGLVPAIHALLRGQDVDARHHRRAISDFTSRHPSTAGIQDAQSIRWIDDQQTNPARRFGSGATI